MKFKEAVKDANKSIKQVLGLMPDELNEAMRFYAQVGRDFLYASKCLGVFVLSCLIMIFMPIFYIYAIVIRMVKK